MINDCNAQYEDIEPPNVNAHLAVYFLMDKLKLSLLFTIQNLTRWIKMTIHLSFILRQGFKLTFLLRLPMAGG